MPNSSSVSDSYNLSSTSETETVSSGDNVLILHNLQRRRTFFCSIPVKLKSVPITDPKKLPYIRQPALAKLREKRIENCSKTLDGLPVDVLTQIFVRLQYRVV